MSNEIIEIVKSFEIVCQEDANKASELRRQLKALEAEIRASFDPIVEQAYKAHKEAIAQRDEHLKPVLEAQKKIKDCLSKWKEKEDLIRLREAMRIAEEKRKSEEEKRLQQAELLEKMGETEKANEILEQPIFCAPETEKIKVEGISFAELWTYEIINEAEIPREYLIPDEKKINAVVKAMKNNIEIPGIKIFKKTIARG